MCLLVFEKPSHDTLVPIPDAVNNGRRKKIVLPSEHPSSMPSHDPSESPAGSRHAAYREYVWIGSEEAGRRDLLPRLNRGCHRCDPQPSTIRHAALVGHSRRTGPSSSQYPRFSFGSALSQELTEVSYYCASKGINLHSVSDRKTTKNLFLVNRGLLLPVAKHNHPTPSNAKVRCPSLIK